MIKLEQIYYGKAKTVFRTDDPDKLIIEFRDSLTAFDGKKKTEIQNKGFYNAQISSKLFDLLEKNDIRTHYIKMCPNSTTEMIVKAVEIIKIEVIVRNISAGRIAKIFPFDIGMHFVPPIIILDYKNDKYGDPMINDDIALALKLASKEELDEIRKISYDINSVIIAYLEQRDLLLPDIKLEFGRYNDKIILADEISCDTCRFWDKYTKESFDKDVFRFDKGDIATAYKTIAKRLVPEILEKSKIN